ncbi:class I SAM-dependent methyltransferase [Thiobacter aerophilum]|uniref:Class I SAM-dependent methyltransferase n=1 Tax=Thiobacter aerophilum TaxID=3121275 RepID=A0ABV0EDW9_9BURK
MALRAALAQLGAGLAVATLAFFFALPAAAWFLLHSLGATTFAAALRLPWWWLPIQFGFVPALLLVASLEIAPAWFLAAFLLLSLIYWSTWRSRVPLYLSGQPVWQAIEAHLPVSGRVLDLGAGLGGPLLYLARRRPDLQFEGIEAAPLPWLASCMRAWGLANLRLRWGSFWRLPLESYDLVFAYLSPAAMPQLWQKVRAEMRPGSLFISVEFPVPGVAADQIIETGGRQRLYLWRF